MNLNYWQSMTPIQQQDYWDKASLSERNRLTDAGADVRSVRDVRKEKHQEYLKGGGYEYGTTGERIAGRKGGLGVPEWYKKLVDITQFTGKADAFITQAQATIDLAGKCELHPFLHSFIDMNDIREEVLKVLGQPGTLYVGGTAEKFLVDSAFDEILDVIVGKLEKCKYG
jgi:hypothetical protein